MKRARRVRAASRASAAGALGAGTVLLVAMLAAGVAPTRAHEVFERAEPAPGADLAESPTAISVWFSDTVGRVRTSLRTTAGADVPLPDQGSPRRVDRLHIPLDPPLPPGAYVFEWQAWTQDHHPAGGAIPFTVRAPTHVP